MKEDNDNELKAKPEEALRVGSTEGLGDGYEHPNGSITCASCGYDVEWEECAACGGEGGQDGYEEDPNWYQPGEMAPCPQCNCSGGDYFCPNSDCPTVTILKIRQAPKSPNSAKLSHSGQKEKL